MKYLRTEDITDSQYIQLKRRVFQLEDGAEVAYEVKYERNSAVAVALTEDNEIILVSQWRPGPGFVLLELPGGHLDTGESIVKGAQRELLEETGYEAGECIHSDSHIVSPYSVAGRGVAVFVGCKKVSEPQNTDREHTEVSLIPFDLFVQNVLPSYYSHDGGCLWSALVSAGLIKVESAL